MPGSAPDTAAELSGATGGGGGGAAGPGAVTTEGITGWGNAATIGPTGCQYVPDVGIGMNGT